MNKELKPCPFCGGEAKIGIKRESAGMDGSYANWIIRCEKCGAMIKCPADGFYGRKALTEDEAIEAWNKRVSDDTAWLRILKKAKFEYDEAWRIITHPTPDVTYADRDRAQTILDTFRDSLGRMEC